GIILGGVEFLSVKLADAPPEVNIALTKIKEAVFRADSVLKNLLRYGRPSKLLAEQIRPEALINEVIELFRYKTPLYNIEISTEYDRQDMFVAVDKSQMQQVFFNLLLNSIDAMPNGGKIIIKTFRASHDGELKSGGAACAIIVSDTGMGVAKEDLDKIFEPFFTTKRDRGGTGLGLGVSKSIVENHGGCLIVTSELGKGTDIKIVLPLAKQGG
ncbi:MAG: hypothetical protein KJ818_06535, partial [Candidatus Omnitrophica bacterium]|nr:hypothetical protein [Candidatus Omnitrophota bacterium]